MLGYLKWEFLEVVQYGIGTVLILSTASVLAVKLVPSLNVLLLYGKTGRSVKKQDTYIDAIAKLTVPKSWFLHFYAIYFGLLASGGLVLHAQGYNCIRFPVYDMLLVQSLRRLLESIYITKFNPSAKMNVAHYLAGLIFYSTISINTFLAISGDVLAPYQGSATTYAVLLLFVGASLDQYCNHLYLSQLVKYTAPTQGLFSILAAPHYLDEVAIYLAVAALSSVGATTKSVITWNYWLSFVFVSINLSISALESYKYYEKKQNKKLWAIFPGLL